MKVEFLSKFVKDLDKLNAVHVKASVIKTIELVETVKNLSEIPNLKKLKGHKSAFRIKIGDYRIGIFIKGKTIEMARVVHRKDIYM
ncbi:MAG TPA: type II toxin-antitoxin system RelE/ParE family toxin [Saprospiraceae bacterium]|nr:type II toxin-antitoxin system RelE/ParE family toxin [Saprospiraceae bacterium]